MEQISFCTCLMCRWEDNNRYERSIRKASCLSMHVNYVRSNKNDSVCGEFLVLDLHGNENTPCSPSGWLAPNVDQLLDRTTSQSLSSDFMEMFLSFLQVWRLCYKQARAFFAAFSKDNKESWGAADVQSPGMENMSDEIELNSGAMREDAGIAMKSKEMSMLY